jgi:inosine-uridine nucleoside N-ribohydrolase
VRPLLLFLFISSFAWPQEKIIFDTDCALFNDDGAALVMLLQQPEKVEVLGLTVVPGNLWPLQGAEYMFHILDLMKKPGIPLFLGARAPLIHTKAMVEKENREWGPIRYMGAFRVDPAASKKTTERRASGHNAIDFLADTLGKYPEPVTILALGPMTNLAIALRMHPEIEKKIKRIVFMGGGVHVPNAEDGRAAEFNFWFDPEAARVVLRSAIPEKVMFGLDICYRAPIDKSHYDQIADVKTPITALLRQDVGKRFEKDPAAKTYVWDCLAAAYLLDPGFVTKRESSYLDVDTTFGKNYGAVIPLDRTLAPDATPVDVTLDLDFARFFGLYRTLLTKAP